MWAPKVRVPAKNVLITATFVSTTVSLIGGVVLYLEAIRVVQDTVKEAAFSDTSQAYHPLSGVFKRAKQDAESMFDLLHHWHPFNDDHELMEWAWKDIFHNINNSLTGGMAIKVVPNYTQYDQSPSGTDPEAYITVDVWLDPLTDPAYIEKWGGNHFFSMQTASTNSHGQACEADDPGEGGYCHRMYSVDRRTLKREQTENYTYVVDVLRRNSSNMAKFQGWETKVVGQWSPVWVWGSADGTPYQYGIYNLAGPLVRDERNPLFGDTFVYVSSYIEFVTVTDMLVGMQLQGRTFLVSGDSVILGNNEGTVMSKECFEQYGNDYEVGLYSGQPHPCVLLGEKQSAVVAAGIRVLANAADRSFIKEILDGEEHWLLRRTVFTPEPHDDVDTIFLAWMRSVSSVDDQLLRSLFFFLGFISIVFVFDAFAVCVEVVKIGKPLSALTKAVRHIDSMDLVRAEEELDLGHFGSCFVISDIQRLGVSLYTMIQCLKRYRTFLPQAVLIELDNSSDDEVITGGHGQVQTRPKLGTIPSFSSPSSDGRRATRPGSDQSLGDMSSQSSVAPMSPLEELSPTFCHKPAMKRIWKQEKRSVAMGVMNVVGSFMVDPEERQHRLRQAVTIALDETLASKGVLEGVVGDRVRCSWNASLPTARYRVHALSAVLNSTGGGMSSAVVSGEALCGAEHANNYSFYLIDGPRVSFGFVLERLAAKECAFIAQRLRLPPQEVEVTLCDESVQLDTAEIIEHRWFNSVQYVKAGPRPIKVWHAVDFRNLGDSGEEWMYELSRQGVWDVYNEVVTKVTLKRPAEAEDALRAMAGQEVMSDIEKLYVEHLRTGIREGVLPPCFVRAHDVWLQEVPEGMKQYEAPEAPAIEQSSSVSETSGPKKRSPLCLVLESPAVEQERNPALPP
eukprot:Hpha_TRINITY_DN16576_c0_g1::TRINITY_DN16576_c0_g1_i1::g.133242::m.133242